VEAVIISCRKLSRKKAPYLYIFMAKKSKWMGWRVHVERVGQTTDPYKASWESLERATLIGRPRSIWERNINIDYETTM